MLKACLKLFLWCLVWLSACAQTDSYPPLYLVWLWILQLILHKMLSLFMIITQTKVDILPFLGVRDEELLKNFFTVVTFRVFSLVFFSSNLEKGPRDGGAGCVWDAAAWDCVPWVMAKAASSSRCSLAHMTNSFQSFQSWVNWQAGFPLVTTEIMNLPHCSTIYWN